jgi:acetyltransferase
MRTRLLGAVPRRRVRLRPLSPRHDALHVAFLQRIDPEDLRLRYGQVPRRLTARDLAQLTAVQPGEIVLVALPPPFRTKAILGVARAVVDAEARSAELGVLVRSDMKRRGIGAALVGALLEECRTRGVAVLQGEVLHENAAMLALARRLGAEIETATHTVYARITFRI